MVTHKTHKARKIFWILIIFLALNLLNIASTQALSLAVHVPEKYTDVVAGERFYFEIEVKYPENPSRKDLRLTYEIKKDNDVIAESKVLKAVETQASFMDFIVIPESAKSGLHIINVKITDYEDLSEEVSASFQVIKGEASQTKMYLLIILGAVGFVGLLVIVNISMARKGG